MSASSAAIVNPNHVLGASTAGTATITGTSANAENSPRTAQDCQDFLVANDTLRDLPPGSSLDPATGDFTWVPPAGYTGPYRLVFTRGDQKVPVTVTIRPAARARRP